MEFFLIIKKINNTLSEEEKIAFDKWYSESEKHRAYFKSVQENKNSKKYLFDKEKNWKAIKGKANIKKKTTWKYYAAAASIALLFSISYLFNPINEKVNTAEITTDVGYNNKAILTLDDGKEILLSKDHKIENALFKSEDKSIAYKKANTKQSEEIATQPEIIYNYLTTKKGGEFSLTLADGTKVWLNSESKLKYPVSFIKGQPRTVELIYGEAYFEVSSSKKNSGDGFNVLNSLQRVSVLGTHFNVKAYPEDHLITTSLIEGKVLVENNEKIKMYLEPNEEITLNVLTLEMQKNEVNAKEKISWVNGYFSFDNTSLLEITKTLSRCYDVDISFEDEKIKDLRFNGVLSKKQDIKFVLDAIINTTDITYEIDNRKIKFRK
ncbi:FecR family protein [Polaribacter sp. AHE13PA]|uniref:FecR family protein n=1 Tax=Polaribacter sp. AHE13PA TaxID=2745562 RepID=UPI001C4EFE91|nr:FecR family protein [Polaribacter sp. AHE13PA]QXP65448.1 FecR family protein [Polaribacter sp. AHE13PA]